MSENATTSEYGRMKTELEALENTTTQLWNKWSASVNVVKDLKSKLADCSMTIDELFDSAKSSGATAYRVSSTKEMPDGELVDNEITFVWGIYQYKKAIRMGEFWYWDHGSTYYLFYTPMEKGYIPPEERHIVT